MNLPQIAFDVDHEKIKVIDRHGRDITELLFLKEIRMKLAVRENYAPIRLEAGLVFLKRDWLVDSENKVIRGPNDYDLSDGLQPSSIVEGSLSGGNRPMIEITFDAVWAPS